ncbi:MAG TPA: ABC transporter transmembrane domain-containing protein [Caulobacterales bacterium]|nr:ABC transporter transmembrane domain-containing protein [Caulobacterales bacterium]
MADPHEPTGTEGRPSRGAVHAAALDREAARRPRSRDVGALRALWPYLLRRKLWLALALLFLALASAATLALPLAARNLVDFGLHGGSGATLSRYFLMLMGAAVLLATFSAARFYFVTRIGERVVADLRADVYERLVGLSPSFFTSVSTGEALSRLTTDAQVIETLVGSSASFALRNLVTGLAGLALLFATSWKLTGLLLLLIPALLVPLFALGRRVRALSIVSQDRLADAASSAAEALDAIETVQAFGQEGRERARYRGALEAAFGASVKRIGARALMTAAVMILVFCGVAGVLWIGARNVLEGQMTPGALTQFVLLAVLSASALASLAETWGDVQKAAGATERLMDLLAQKPAIAAPASPVVLPQPTRGLVEFDKVSFAYPGAEGRSSLHEFSLRVAPGETVALVGPSGAGKSTIFRLLLRFYDPDSGAVRLDGVDARQADPGAWRAHFSYVAQDAALFSGSAMENIRYGKADARDEEIAAAARAAEAEAFILDRPEGYNAPLGARAKALSGGERQRLALARALVRGAPVLLLDEATSALDSENEMLVQRAIESARAGRTTLVIAHRLSTVLRADRIVVMDGGRVVEQGRHEDLSAQGGLYARLARLQFAGAG